MNQEQWIKWEPIKDLNTVYEIIDVTSNPTKFTILMEDFRDETKKINIFFKNSVAAYRYTEESYRLNISSLFIQPSGENLYGLWVFFKVNHSTYLSWLKQHFSIFSHTPYTHFVFVGANAIIDVVTNYDPKIILHRERS